MNYWFIRYGFVKDGVNHTKSKVVICHHPFVFIRAMFEYCWSEKKNEDHPPRSISLIDWKAITKKEYDLWVNGPPKVLEFDFKEFNKEYHFV